MKNKVDSLLGNQTWEQIVLLTGKKKLYKKWEHQLKTEHNGNKCID